MPRKLELSADLMGPRGPNADFTYVAARSLRLLCSNKRLKAVTMLFVLEKVDWYIIVSLLMIMHFLVHVVHVVMEESVILCVCYFDFCITHNFVLTIVTGISRRQPKPGYLRARNISDCLHL